MTELKDAKENAVVTELLNIVANYFDVSNLKLVVSMTQCTVIKSSNGGKEKVHKRNSRNDFDLDIQKSQGQYMSCTMRVNNISAMTGTLI